MELKQTDNELDLKIKEIMTAKIPEPEILNQKLEAAYQQINNTPDRDIQTGNSLSSSPRTSNTQFEHAQINNTPNEDTHTGNSSSSSLLTSDTQSENSPFSSPQDESSQNKDLQTSSTQSRKKKMPMALKCSAAAAVLLLAMVYCIKNPAFAAQLPFIGNIFSDLEEKVSYPGDYSKNSIKLPLKENTGTEPADSLADAADTDSGHADHSEEAPNTAENDSPALTNENTDARTYTKKSGGMTVTLSEVSYDCNGIYLAILAESEEGFASNLFSPDRLGFTCWVTMYEADGSKTEFNQADGTYLAYEAEGEYTDEHTFKGIAQFCSDSLDLTKYTSCELTFTEFQQRLTTGKEQKAHLPETNEEVTIIDHDIVRCKGNWKFRLEPEISPDTRQEISVNDTNDQGFGIEKVIRTKFEIYGVPILPEGEQWYDYIVTIWDADGKPLDHHGSDPQKRSVYGRDVSQVTVYLLRWEDFCESKGSNSHLQPSKAIYQTTVRFDS